MIWPGNVACMEEKRNAYRILMGKPNGKRLLRKPSHIWVDTINLDLKEIRCN
jgi:hypothetical protein